MKLSGLWWLLSLRPQADTKVPLDASRPGVASRTFVVTLAMLTKSLANGPPRSPWAQSAADEGEPFGFAEAVPDAEVFPDADADAEGFAEPDAFAAAFADAAAADAFTALAAFGASQTPGAWSLGSWAMRARMSGSVLSFAAAARIPAAKPAARTSPMATPRNRLRLE
jgi:hypothetical protein